MSVVWDRPVGFDETDAAGIVFFARFFHWCHEAMERFFDGVPGGYVELITRRRIGFPTVHATADWKLPFRYGDTTRIETSVVRLGTTSATLRFGLSRLRSGSKVAEMAATIEHVCVATALDTMTKLPVPDDCRALLEAHVITAADATTTSHAR
jgi:4-hydroxybenzoyl-CoA thioesterase